MSPAAPRALQMAALVIAGEAIFGLPFIIARIFRPTLLEVFGITNLELGTAFSVYGIVAMVAYVPGGPLADRFSARKLMTAALLATAAGGLAFVQRPGLSGLTVLYGGWGCTTILLFWAAMIRATREWGGADEQGRAFGILDGGRGLLAAVLASASVAAFASALPGDPAQASLAEKTHALQVIIWVFTGATALAAALVWRFVPDADAAAVDEQAFSWAHIGPVLRNPAVWLQGLIVVTAYTGYKAIDDLGLYARDVFGFDEVQAAQVGTVAFWVRPVAAVGAGWIGDRVGAVPAILAAFGVMVAGDLAIAMAWLQPGLAWTLFMTVAVTSAAVYGLRGLYFAIFDQAGIAPALTGTAAGVVSLVGFTPDVFMGPLMGWCTDTYPGALGHQYLFGAMAGFAGLGLLVTLAFWAYVRRKPAR